jgi:two-component system phosphate regulon sensor histidine kinase PhoR
MGKGSLFVRFILLIWVPVFICVSIITIVSLSSWRNWLLTQRKESLEQTLALTKLYIDEKTYSGPAELQNDIRKLAQVSSAHITLIRDDGSVFVDSLTEELDTMENQRTYQEVGAALVGKKRFVMRENTTIGDTYLYLAESFTTHATNNGVLRIGVSTQSMQQQMIQNAALLISSILVTLCMIILLGYFYTEQLRSALEEIREYIAGLQADQHYDTVPALEAPREFRALSLELNSVVTRIKAELNNTLKQNQKSKAVLSSMVEPVILLDNKLRIQEINEAACRLFNLRKEAVVNRSILEVIRNSELQEFAQNTLKSSTPIESSITIYKAGLSSPQTKSATINSGAYLHLQVNGTIIASNSNGEEGDNPQEPSGVLLVLNDITTLKNLESIRRDFVANVSHELKTPITSIKGFVETLIGGALEQPDKAHHFLGIISKQADRLTNIINDLLSLSRLEQQNERQLDFESYSLSKVAASAAHVCRKSADKKQVTINLDLEDTIPGKINPLLLEQALVNLIDNAIKYSEPKSTIHISTEKKDKYHYLEVADNGSGIPAKHLDRIFERFYRVDKARSRELGGTGLGLAIVKHIILAHGGEISVESAPGKGSTFTIKLPA